MMAEHIASVLEELRGSTDRLFVTTNRVDVDKIEEAVALREKAVIQLRALIENHPDSFTPEDLESVRTSHFKGKKALEKLLETRRKGWVTATELAKNEYVLKSFARFGNPPENRTSR